MTFWVEGAMMASVYLTECVFCCLLRTPVRVSSGTGLNGTSEHSVYDLISSLLLGFGRS
jgi:hypothetical protein